MIHDFISEMARVGKHRWVILLTITALSATLLVYLATPADPQERAPQPPPGDCWNSALSRENVHCYILEEAQRAGTDRGCSGL